MGAMGMAAEDLHFAASFASECAAGHSNLQAAWKLLGDAHLEHTAVTPLAEFKAAAAAPPGAQSAEAAEAAMLSRARAMRSARVAYSKALHLDPTQGDGSCGHWYGHESFRLTAFDIFSERT
jgi:Flp pilus assembly protein TadD